jgi:hypothetical protein
MGGNSTMRSKMMLIQKARTRRTVIGRISLDTKGPPGTFMEGTGLWDGQHLAD